MVAEMPYTHCKTYVWQELKVPRLLDMFVAIADRSITVADSWKQAINLSSATCTYVPVIMAGLLVAGFMRKLAALFTILWKAAG